MNRSRVALWAVLAAFALPASASPFFFSTGDPDGLMAMASRPAGVGLVEIESADDFVLNTPTSIASGTFTGLLAGIGNVTVTDARIEIYRVFPNDSDSTRTPQVTTRANSPSDVALYEFDAADADVSFTTTVLDASFTAANSVLNGIHLLPGQMTGGEGAVRGQEIQVNFTFTTPLALPADHYFFVPQISVEAGGQFYWLSAPLPIVAPGTPFMPDLQTWIRNGDLAPDWSRVGTDIVGGDPAPHFNAAFSLSGQTLSTVPEPATGALLAAAFAALALVRRQRSLTSRGR
jgi:hypothetical protein